MHFDFAQCERMGSPVLKCRLKVVSLKAAIATAILDYDSPAEQGKSQAS
ncbi:hypothetical protein [Sphingomonas pseudosanguinis]